MRTCIIGEPDFQPNAELTTRPSTYKTDFSIICDVVPESSETFVLTITCKAILTENNDEVARYSVASNCPMAYIHKPFDCDVVSYMGMLNRYFISILGRGGRIEKEVSEYLLTKQPTEKERYESIQKLIKENKIQQTIFNSFIHPNVGK